MIKRAIDTSPEAEEVQLRLLRQASSARHIELVRSLSKTVMQMSWQGLVRRNPSLLPMDVDILFVKLNYGPDLAERLKKYLRARELE